MPDEREYRGARAAGQSVSTVDRLPETQRQVIQMRFIEERSIRAVAAALDRSEGRSSSRSCARSRICEEASRNARQGVPANRNVMADLPLHDRLDDVIDALVARGDDRRCATRSWRHLLAYADLRHYPNRDHSRA